MKDFLKWLVIGPVVGLGLYFLSGKDIDINTDVLEKSVNAEDIFNQPSEDTGQSEIDALIETFKEVCAEGSSESEEETKTKRKKSCLFRGCKRCRK